MRYLNISVAQQVQNAATKYGEGGDFSLFVDDDGAGYLIYTSLAEAHSISVAPLTPDFMHSVRKTPGQ